MSSFLETQSKSLEFASFCLWWTLLEEENNSVQFSAFEKIQSPRSHVVVYSLLEACMLEGTGMFSLSFTIFLRILLIMTFNLLLKEKTLLPLNPIRSIDLLSHVLSPSFRALYICFFFVCSRYILHTEICLCLYAWSWRIYKSSVDSHPQYTDSTYFKSRNPNSRRDSHNWHVC